MAALVLINIVCGDNIISNSKHECAGEHCAATRRLGALALGNPLSILRCPINSRSEISSVVYRSECEYFNKQCFSFCFLLHAGDGQTPSSATASGNSPGVKRKRANTSTEAIAHANQIFAPASRTEIQ